MTHFDSTQTLLRASVQAFNERSPGPARLRAVRALAPHLDRAAWREICDAGWAGVLVPEALGGVGLGPAEAALIALELGRGLAPEPYIACALLPTLVLAPLAQAAGVRDLLAALVEGRVIAALAWQEAPGRYDPATCSLQLRQNGETVRLEGPAKCLVPLAGAMDGFIVTASAQGRPALLWVAVDAPGLRVETTRTVDGQTTGTVDLTDVVLTGDAVLAQGEAVGEVLVHALALAPLMAAYELIGVLERALESTLAYTKLGAHWRPALRITLVKSLAHPLIFLACAWLLDLFGEWVCDAALRTRILATNAAELYRF